MYGIAGINSMMAGVGKSASQSQQIGWTRTPLTSSGNTGDSTAFQNIMSSSANQGASAVQQGQTLDQRTADLISRLDKDSDGMLSSQEMGISADAFSRIDTNSDGKLDMHELNAAYLQAHASQQYGNALNGSGTGSSSASSASTVSL